MAEAKPTPKHTASWHTSAYHKKHPEASKPDELETAEKPRKWFVSTQHGALWLWERAWDWPFVAWIVAAICVGLAYLVAQEHMYLVSRVLVGIGIVLVFLKVHHSVNKADMPTGAQRAVSVMTAIFLVLVAAGGFWILGEMQRVYEESLPRADLHVDEVTVEFQDMTKAYGAMSGLLGSSWPGGILVHIKGHNQSQSTPTNPYPMVKAAISARPYITNPEEEKALFTQGKWSNEAYIGFPALRRNLNNSSINGGFRGGDFSVRSAG